MITVAELNEMDTPVFVERYGGFFEHSPWITERALAHRPFARLREFHDACMRVVTEAGTDAAVELITAHPDLVGRLAREGRLGAESTAEQRAAGLDQLSEEEIGQFERYNDQYREAFGFPFVICARENRKDAILAAFPVRLNNNREDEIETALQEIGKIAWLRMADVIETDSEEREE